MSQQISQQMSQQPDNPTPLFNPLVLLNLVAQDHVAFQGLLNTFLRITPLLLAQLKTEIALENQSRIRIVSHSLKGVMSLVGSGYIMTRLIAVEPLLQHGDTQGVTAILSEVLFLSEILIVEIKQYIGIAAGGSKDGV